MSFTQDDVNKLAHLARLSLNADPQNENSFENSIAEDLNNILRLVSKISEINTDNLEPLAHSYAASQRCRADQITEPNVRDIMQTLVPPQATAAGLYLVPQVVETEA